MFFDQMYFFFILPGFGLSLSESTQMKRTFRFGYKSKNGGGQ